MTGLIVSLTLYGYKNVFYSDMSLKAAIMKSICSSVTNVTYATISVNHSLTLNIAICREHT